MEAQEEDNMEEVPDLESEKSVAESDEISIVKVAE